LFISQVECGRKQPSLVTIFQIAKALAMTALGFVVLICVKERFRSFSLLTRILMRPKIRIMKKKGGCHAT